MVVPLVQSDTFLLFLPTVISWKMRNAFVVLVSLCIGLAFGFIVPSGGLELIDANQAILADNNGKQSEEANAATLQEGTGFIVLPFRTNNETKINLETNRNSIKDKELYEQDTTNHNNVNERSFIIINQKFKTPVVNQLYSSQDVMSESYKTLVSEVSKNQNQYPAKYTPSYNNIPKTKKEFFVKTIERAGTKNLYFPPANNQEMNKVLVSDRRKELTPKRPSNKFNDVQREYIELLKQPLLRPILTYDKKDDKAWTLPDQGSPKIQTYTKNTHVTSLPVGLRQFSLEYYDNFRFPTPYGYQRSALNFNYKPEEIKMGTNSSVKKVTLDKHGGEASKFSNRHLKESLEDQIMHERMHVKSENCSYRNCVAKSTKHLNNRAKGDAECKCRRRLNILKQRESNGYKGREVITEKFIVSTESLSNIISSPKSSEISDYVDMLAEEMNIKKLIED